MSVSIADLTAVLEQEIAVAEALSLNLATQKDAIMAWDASGLLSALERREECLRSLGSLEQRRNEIVEQIDCPVRPVTLRRLMAQLPAHSPERIHMAQLRERASYVFSRLRSEERYLTELSETLLSHIQGALSPFVPDAAPVYTETGAAGRQRAASALVHSKA